MTMKMLCILSSYVFGLVAEAEPLVAGQKLPDVPVRVADGSAVSFHELAAGRKTVVVFYRGGWCPYCNTHLAALAEAEEALRDAGWQIVAVSPDRPEKIREALAGKPLPYRLVSDSEMNAAKAFGLAFTVDDETFAMLKGYGIDLEAASGKSHRMLPVPGVFLVDETGTLTFAHHDPNYKVRLSNKELLKAAGVE